MVLGILTLQLRIPGCTSLKEKRSRLKPLLVRLQREFNVSVAEIGLQDAWGEALVCCALVSSDLAQTQRSLQQVVHWVETYWRDVELMDDTLEII